MKASELRSFNTARVALLIGGSIVIAILATLSVLYASGALTGRNRQAIVRDRGTQIMPFDLNQTTHIFTATSVGGVEQVIAKDPNNAEQIRLIQEHLEHETRQFSQGNFSDPAAIHDTSMPGLAELKAGVAHIQFTFTPLPDGAQMTYTTQDPSLIKAIHDWFTAQTTDHGHDAMSH